MIKLIGKSLQELRQIALEAGLPAFAGGQIARWIYLRRVRSIDAMTDLSKAGREALKARYEVGIPDYTLVQTSSDGTRKYLFTVRCPRSSALFADEAGEPLEESSIEAVMIPDGERRTLCVSSQAGCKMGCKFCMTGRQGFHGNLSAADIIGQILGVDEAGELSNVVFMGMGEPLDNYENLSRSLEILTAPWGLAWSPKRITVSTVGVVPALRRLLDEHKCHVAVSLHDPYPAERGELMPAQKAFPSSEVLALLRRYDFSGQRRISFEYTMFSGLNDSPRHASELARLLRNLECRVNLIRFHKIPDFPYWTSSDGRMEAFRDHLSRCGITATIRASRGEDILAACGMLAGRHDR